MNEWWLIGGFSVLFIIALWMVLYPLRQFKLTSFIVAPIVLSFVVLMYWQWGGFVGLTNYHRHQQVEALLETIHDPNEVVEQLKQRLKRSPNSAKGWYLLGRVYGSQNQWVDAHESFERAQKIKPNDIKIKVNNALSLWQLNHQSFNNEIRSLFLTVLQKDKNQPDALSMLAMDSFLRHAYKPAIEYWQRLLTLVPPQSEEAKAIRRAIAKAQQNI